MINVGTVASLVTKYGPTVAKAVVEYGPTVLDGINKYGPKVAKALGEIEKNIKAAKKLGVEVAPSHSDAVKEAEQIIAEVEYAETVQTEHGTVASLPDVATYEVADGMHTAAAHAQANSTADTSSKAYKIGSKIGSLKGAIKQAKTPQNLIGTAASNVGGMLKSAGEKVSNPIKEAQFIRELEAENAKTVRKVLESSSYSASYTDFVKQMEKGPDAVKIGLFNQPGCYAIATYSNLNLSGNPSAYSDVYVGQGNRVADDILACCSKHGCADVYADIKYKQNVRVYIFSCLPDHLDEKQDALIEVLDADSSYNAID